MSTPRTRVHRGDLRHAATCLSRARGWLKVVDAEQSTADAVGRYVEAVSNAAEAQAYYALHGHFAAGSYASLIFASGMHNLAALGRSERKEKP